MLRFTKSICGLALLALGVQHASAFALLGPTGNGGDSWQAPVIGYGLPYIEYVIPGAPVSLGDIGGPKNYGEEYRRNTPVLYYSFDQNFIEYFGTNGIAAVEQAVAILNSLTNVSLYSTELSEFPLEAQQFNYQAQALSLTDLKSVTLHLLVEQLGLAQPDRYTWTLHDRGHFNGAPACPEGMYYSVTKRNFDPISSTIDQLQYSSYVNGTLYSYRIFEFCTGPDPLGEAIEFPVDPLANSYTAVAADAPNGLQIGGYYTGLTRDDVGGLRYLFRSSNVNVESAGTNTFTFVTNNVSELLYTSNLTALVNQSLTNDTATLLALFPDLVISSTTEIFTNVVSTNVFFYFTNFPNAPAGTSSLVYQTNLTTNVVTWFDRSFANVVTNRYYTNGFITILQTNIAPCPLAPAGVICTNVTQFTVPTNFINGEYFILPTNVCEFSIISTQLNSVLTLTNTPVVATNAAGTINTNNQFSQSLVFYFTNHVYVARRLTCPESAVALREGIERITFVRRDYDSLFNQFYYPITNSYTLIAITNNVSFPQRVQRVVTQPDILFSAADLATGPAANAFNGTVVRNTLGYNQDHVLSQLAGPGTIEGVSKLTYNKVGPIYENDSTVVDPYFLTEESTGIQLLAWASFDGSTNAPVIYGGQVDATVLENQILMPITTASLATGAVNVAYSEVLSATGGQPPYTWSLSPNSPSGLPPVLTLDPGGTISGTPTMSGVFDIVVRVTDTASRFTDRTFTLTINP